MLTYFYRKSKKKTPISKCENKIRKTRRHGLYAAAVFFFAVFLLCGCGREARSYPLGNRISNSREIVTGIRNGLKDHASSITIRFSYGSDIFDELNQVIEDWVEAALEETDDPAEGDYLRYQYGGYTYQSSYTMNGERREYTVILTPEYYCYASQEAAASEKMNEILGELGFTRHTEDIEKIRAVYGWICGNVRYDRRGLRNAYDHESSTAYGAVIQNLATCQGYCTALYRMLRESGISCRIITGSAGEESLHAWVIARVDGRYYHLDPTWDAEQEEYRYFLVGTQHFTDHQASERFLTEEFLSAYPLSEIDYSG